MANTICKKLGGEVVRCSRDPNGPRWEDRVARSVARYCTESRGSAEAKQCGWYSNVRVMFLFPSRYYSTLASPLFHFARTKQTASPFVQQLPAFFKANPLKNMNRKVFCIAAYTIYNVCYCARCRFEWVSLFQA